jgi:hypothetical protein
MRATYIIRTSALLTVPSPRSMLRARGLVPQGTFTAAVDGLNPAGAIAGDYLDASNVFHGYVRASNGAITTFDAPGAGKGSGQGTFSGGINPVGTVMGVSMDANSVSHGFVRP